MVLDDNIPYEGSYGEPFIHESCVGVRVLTHTSIRSIKKSLWDSTGWPNDTKLHVELGTKPKYFLIRSGRGSGIANDSKQKLEAASGFQLLHRGFAPPSEHN